MAPLAPIVGTLNANKCNHLQKQPPVSGHKYLTVHLNNYLKLLILRETDRGETAEKSA